ncbi:hypothetical protein ACFSTA_07005 [Ornithinibacillus salinisoli]|uniref:Lipoprotein n=1 Tax=Ornithinibacillus salinisoli TaxID=1848459 RepID=A0ABW4VZ83_9BACI
MWRKVAIFISLSLFIVLLAVLSLTGSFPHFGLGNPTAKEILNGNPNADILKLDGLIYSNASDLEWIKSKEYTKGDKIGEIKKQTTNTLWYRNFYASKLPKGTIIYDTNDREYTKGDAPMLIIIEHNNEILIYRSLVEG